MLAFISKHKTILFPILFLLFLILGCWVNSADMLLATPQAKHQIVSLELAWSHSSAQDIKESWDCETMKAAIRSINRDYFFIVSYVLLLAFIVLALNRGRVLLQHSRIFLLLILLAAALDITENIGMTLFLKGKGVSVILFSLPATIKFAFLIATILYVCYALRHNFIYFTWLLKTFRVYFAGISSVAIIYWLLIQLIPGQDIVMQIGEDAAPFFATLFCAVLWSGYSWYSSRLVAYVKSNQPEDIIPDSFHEHAPRLIAFNAMVSIQAAILALPTIAALTEGQLWTFVLIQNVLYLIWHNWITTTTYRIAYAGILSIALIAYVTEVAWLVLRPQPLVDHQKYLPYIALFLFAFEFFLVKMFIVRRQKIKRKESESSTSTHEPQAVAALRIFTLKIIQVPAQVLREEQIFFSKFNLAALTGLVLYFAGFFSLYLAGHLGSLAVTLLSLAILVGLANIITVASITNKTNLFFYIFVFAIVVGRFYDPYKVRLLETNSSQFYAHRPTMEHYFSRWIEYRREKIKGAAGKFPVYLVIADGGASRSGYWVSSVLAALQDSSVIKNSSDPFADHLLCLGGASGGSVGNATFYALLKNLGSNSGSFLQHSQAFLKQDFLAPVITHWLGSDLIQHIIPLPVVDRAGVLEQAMERSSTTHLFKSFEQAYSQVVDTTGRLPMLFINVTNVQDGTPGVVSSVHLDTFSERLDVLDSVEKAKPDAKGDLRFSTAVVLGARFPYVSPGGNIGNENYADGGYFDNTGAGIVHEMMQKVDSLVSANSRDSVFSKLRFHLIYLSNSSDALRDRKKIHPLLNDAATPLLTVLGTYASQTKVNNQRLITFIRQIKPAENSYTQINLYTKKDTIDYPMNWVISDYNLNRMDQRLKALKRTSDFTDLLP